MVITGGVLELASNGSGSFLTGKKIFVAGGSGLVGSALLRQLSQFDCEVAAPSSRQVDLRDGRMTRDFFQELRPDVAILAAARVGGIGANQSQPYNFLMENLEIELNFVSSAHLVNVSRLVFLGSSCIYPRLAPQPIPEDALMTGALEPTNTGYAMAKLSGIEMVSAVRAQFGRSWISVLPSNLYGPHDNFNLDSSHVVPALLRKFHEAKTSGAPTVELWGSGLVRREFLHSYDAAAGILFALEKYDDSLPLNIGYGEDVTIAELAVLVADVVGFDGEIGWNRAMPDGVPRKLLDSSRIRSLGWKPSIGLKEGLTETYSWMIERLASLRK